MQTDDYLAMVRRQTAYGTFRGFITALTVTAVAGSVFLIFAALGAMRGPASIAYSVLGAAGIVSAFLFRFVAVMWADFLDSTLLERAQRR